MIAVPAAERCNGISGDRPMSSSKFADATTQCRYQLSQPSVLVSRPPDVEMAATCP
jgi:hypothetical protein